jgi:glycosyltransferase involved in cell wall biosynthesis
MTIGIDASRANRKLKTGTEWYAFHVIKNLIALDRKNNYLLYLDVDPSPDLAATVANYGNVKFKKLNWPWPYFWTLGRLSLEMIFNKPDVLFVPAHSLPLIRPKKTVTTIHDIAFIRERTLYKKQIVQVNNRNMKRVLNLFIRFLTRGRYSSNSLDYLLWSTAYALKKAKAIIAVSEFTKSEILDVYSRRYEKKIKVVHNAYDNNIYKVINNEDKKAKVLDKYNLKSPFFLYVGRLERKKNTPALVEAFALFKEAYPASDMKLLMIGNAGFGYDEIKYIIEEYNLEDSVLMPGWAEEADLPVIFNSAFAFVFPTLHEGFGIPVLQAMACKTPTLISNLPVLREVADKAAFYFNPRDKEDVFRAMASIYEDPGLRAKLTKLGLERSALFSWQESAKKTLTIMENL